MIKKILMWIIPIVIGTMLFTMTNSNALETDKNNCQYYINKQGTIENGYIVTIYDSKWNIEYIIYVTNVGMILLSKKTKVMRIQGN